MSREEQNRRALKDVLMAGELLGVGESPRAPLSPAAEGVASWVPWPNMMPEMTDAMRLHLALLDIENAMGRAVELLPDGHVWRIAFAAILRPLRDELKQLQDSPA